MMVVLRLMIAGGTEPSLMIDKPLHHSHHKKVSILYRIISVPGVVRVAAHLPHFWYVEGMRGAGFGPRFARLARARPSPAVEEPIAHFVFDVADIRPYVACDVVAGTCRQAL